jgi:hypothetical protein
MLQVGNRTRSADSGDDINDSGEQTGIIQNKTDAAQIAARIVGSKNAAQMGRVRFVFSTTKLGPANVAEHHT